MHEIVCRIAIHRHFPDSAQVEYLASHYCVLVLTAVLYRTPGYQYRKYIYIHGPFGRGSVWIYIYIGDSKTCINMALHGSRSY